MLNQFYLNLGKPLSGIGAPQSLNSIVTLENLPNPIKGQLTKKGYLYIKEVIESEKRTKIERRRFWLTLLIAAIATGCSVLQLYTTILLDKGQAEIKTQQYKINRTVDSLSKLQKQNPKP